MTSDLPLGKSETTLGQLLIYGPHSLPILLSSGHDWFPMAVVSTERSDGEQRGIRPTSWKRGVNCFHLFRTFGLALFWLETPVSSSVSFL